MLKEATVYFISLYQQHIKPVLPSSCRFSPSCSEYAKQAVLRYGFYKGLAKAAKRIMLCHPYSGKAGWDPLI